MQLPSNFQNIMCNVVHSWYIHIIHFILYSYTNYADQITHCTMYPCKIHTGCGMGNNVYNKILHNAVTTTDAIWFLVAESEACPRPCVILNLMSSLLYFQITCGHDTEYSPLAIELLLMLFLEMIV